MVFIKSYKEISSFLGIELNVQIGIPQEGGWKTNLFFGVSFIGLSPFITLLTGETADEWAKKGNTYIIKQINDFITTESSDLPEELPKECIKPKNKIYKQFQKDRCIDTFCLGDIPPIPRNNFDRYIKNIPEEEVLYLGTTNITVHSPDWIGKRSWKGNIEILEDTDSSFNFDKDLTGKFWEKIKLDLLPLHTTDVMKVQLVERPTKQVRYLVIRVLSYNEEEIDTPINDKDISKFAVIDGNNNKEDLNLFSFEDGQFKDNHG